MKTKENSGWKKRLPRRLVKLVKDYSIPAGNVQELGDMLDLMLGRLRDLNSLLTMLGVMGNIFQTEQAIRKWKECFDRASAETPK